ncbi:MAG: hypothetical protein VB143_08595 [Burkholderia sp.]
MASISQHKDGWRAQVYVLGQRDSKVLRTQREAKAWAAARELELRRQKTAAPGDLHTVRVPARIVWTRFCNSGGLFEGGCLTGFMG